MPHCCSVSVWFVAVLTQTGSSESQIQSGQHLLIEEQENCVSKQAPENTL